jgi:flagellar basal-body rod modification protein FlgD
MSSIAAVSRSSPAAALESDAVSRVPQKNLGQDDFLKLLATQFKTQDPMKPMDDTAFIAQMAQFTALQQSSSMAQTMTDLRSDQLRATANSFLGHRVTVDAGKGLVATGEVTVIDSSGSVPQLVINGTPYPLSAVLRVEQPAVAAAEPTPASG